MRMTLRGEQALVGHDAEANVLEEHLGSDETDQQDNASGAWTQDTQAAT